MEQIFAYMIMPKEIVDLRIRDKDKDEFLDFWCEPYRESITLEAERFKAKIGELQREDLGLCSKEEVAKLNRRLGNGEENDCESYVVRFYAEVLEEPVLVGAV